MPQKKKRECLLGMSKVKKKRHSNNVQLRGTEDKEVGQLLNQVTREWK